MKWKLPLLLLLFAGQSVFCKIVAQVKNHNLTIVYDITIRKTKRSTGIEETYNGGTKAVFISDSKARIRLVSLMRMESIFFDYDSSTLKEVRVIKESGSKKYQYKLTAADWENYNSKYAGATCDTISDSIIIAGYTCKKAVLHLSSGEEIITYYTNSISIGNKFIDPAFTCIPGTVLQYEYVSNRGSVIFKASEVKKEPIAKDVFVIPTGGIAIRKYIPKK
ncbi:MAG: hypothetical protein V4685_00720 [Bacteroidota bacterium]